MRLRALAQAFPLRRRAAAAAPARVHGSCANCGAPIDDAYCPRCGQETSRQLPTARAFLRDAAGRYVALDGRLWRTLGALFFRPGFLTQEYLAGRRRRYVRPGRLFLVLSIALFAVIRLGADESDLVVIDPKRPQAVEDGIPSAPPQSAPSQSAQPPSAPPQSAPATASQRDDEATRPSSQIAIGTTKSFTVDDGFNIDLRDLGSGSPWLDPVKRRIEAFNRLPSADKSTQLFAGMLRYGPYALIALLPVFALLLKLAYVGRARRYPARPRLYAAHLIYATHSEAFAALALLLMILIPLGVVRWAIAIWVGAYLLWSMHRVYGGRWIGTVARALVLSFAFLICYAVAMAALVVAAIALR